MGSLWDERSCSATPANRSKGRGPVDRVSDDIGSGLRGFSGSPGSTRLSQGLEGPTECFCDTPAHPLEVLDRDSGFGQTDAIVQALEYIGCSSGFVDRGLDLGLGGRAVDVIRQQLDPRPQRIALKSACAGQIDGLGQQGFCFSGTTRFR